jgi:uncharacterized protein YqjF (DUF2071 family)
MAQVSGTGVITCEWRDLLMATWAVDPALVEPHVPRRTTLDLWHGQALLSIVGVRFLNLQVADVAVPFHRQFEQINFRFYVRREMAGISRRGVVFLKQIVPSSSMALVATLLYNESYLTTATRHEIQPGEKGWTLYEWMVSGRWNRISATRSGGSYLPADSSIEAFIENRPWSYTRQADGSTLEFLAEHPPWEVWPTEEMLLDCDVAPIVGAEYVPVLSAPPISTFVAVGSAATLHPGRTIA